MPLTLYFFIARELLKLLALATAVLVAVMALGFCIKPLSDGALTPGQLAKLLVLMMPAMLIYAVPVAAAFAATLVFFRMAADNEITAAAVSGVSYRSILFPVALMGMGLTLGMFFLSNFVLPVFWTQAERTLQQDAVRVVLAELNDHRAVELGDLVLYADHAELQEVKPQPNANANANANADDDAEAAHPQPDQRAVLQHAAAGKLNQQGRFTGTFTSRLAVADFYRRSDRLYAMLRFVDATVDDSDSGSVFATARRDLGPLALPQAFEINPDMLSLPELRKRYDQPLADDNVAQAARTLREKMVVREAVDRIAAQLETDRHTGVVLLRAPEGRDVMLQAPIIARRADHLVLAADGPRPILVRAGTDVALNRRYEARRGRLTIRPGVISDQPRMRLTLEDVRVRASDLPIGEQQLGQLFLTELRLPGRALGPSREMTAPQLLANASTMDARPVHDAAVGLQRHINDLRREISATVHERAAMAIAIMLVLVLGATLAMWLRGRTPLVIFFWCFIPAILAVLLINSGENVLSGGDNSPLVGIAIIWSALVVLAVVLMVVYERLQRN